MKFLSQSSELKSKNNQQRILKYYEIFRRKKNRMFVITKQVSKSWKKSDQLSDWASRNAAKNLEQ
jgi:hypothetical protein